MSAYRSGQWDPVLLLSQLGAMQAVFYAGLTTLLAVMDAAAGTDRSLAQIFRYQSVSLRDSGGGRLAVVFLLNALVFAGGLWAVVGRAKLCLDFAASAHVLHLVLCWVTGSFPVSASWWLLQVVSAALATVLGEFLCMRTEMRAIPVGAFASARSDV